MDNSVDFQIWLEFVNQPQAAIIMPYVQSLTEGKFRYRIDVKQRQHGNVSTITQGGTVYAMATQPTSLSRISVNLPAKGGQCDIDVIVTNSDGVSVSESYPCR